MKIVEAALCLGARLPEFEALGIEQGALGVGREIPDRKGHVTVLARVSPSLADHVADAEHAQHHTPQGVAAEPGRAEYRIENEKAVLIAGFLDQGDAGGRLRHARVDRGIDRGAARLVGIEVEADGLFIAVQGRGIEHRKIAVARTRRPHPAVRRAFGDQEARQAARAKRLDMGAFVRRHQRNPFKRLHAGGGGQERRDETGEFLRRDIANRLEERRQRMKGADGGQQSRLHSGDPLARGAFEGRLDARCFRLPADMESRHGQEQPRQDHAEQYRRAAASVGPSRAPAMYFRGFPGFAPGVWLRLHGFLASLRWISLPGKVPPDALTHA